jgi:alkyl sulfatase BDS1-like metallo-beta-lactamase superfamily hydrolase
VISLGHWAARSPSGQPPDAPIGADSIILALRARFDPGAAKGLRAAYELRLGEDRFRIEVADGEISVAREAAERADATIETDPDTIAAVLWGGDRLAGAQRSGKLKLEGDKAAVERFVRLFPVPEPAAVSRAATPT